MIHGDKQAIAYDAYNFTAIGNKSKTLRASRADTDHITVVFCKKNEMNKKNNGVVCMTTEKNTVIIEEKSPAIMARDYKSPPIVFQKKGEAWAIGNGQVHQLYLQPKVGALNAMHDAQIVLKANILQEG